MRIETPGGRDDSRSRGSRHGCRLRFGSHDWTAQSAAALAPRVLRPGSSRRQSQAPSGSHSTGGRPELDRCHRAGSGTLAGLTAAGRGASPPIRGSFLETTLSPHDGSEVTVPPPQPLVKPAGDSRRGVGRLRVANIRSLPRDSGGEEIGRGPPPGAPCRRWQNHSGRSARAVACAGAHGTAWPSTKTPPLPRVPSARDRGPTGVG